MSSSPSSAPKSLRIGVMLERVQLTDIVGIDIFGNLSTEYFKAISTITSEMAPYESHALDLTVYYLSTSLDPSEVTPLMKYVPNMTYDDCPRDLDIILVGGNAFSDRPPQAERFLKEAWDKTPVFMTTCIGSLWVASAGVLDGCKATTNRGALKIAKQMYPSVEWLDQRWVVDEKSSPIPGRKGELWTAGGAGCGIEMIATYCLQNFDIDFVSKLALDGLDLHPNGSRGQFYRGASVDDERDGY